MTTALAIFVKTPCLSPVKTRLAHTIGSDKALEFYHLCIEVIIQLAKDSGFEIYWAVGEEEGRLNNMWRDFNVLYTGQGCLGQRQSLIYHQLLERHPRALLICTDTPQLSQQILQQAEQVLNDTNYVIGPSTDGGYYIFGGCKPIEEDIWRSIPWSSEYTRKVFENKINDMIYNLPLLTDVDEEKDIPKMLIEMPEDSIEQQQTLSNWARNLTLSNRTRATT